MSGISFRTSDMRVEFGVTTVPNRKNKALYLARGCQCEVLAYFTSDENAKRFQDALNLIIDCWAVDTGLNGKGEGR